jgi:hypothetical protein
MMFLVSYDAQARRTDRLRRRLIHETPDLAGACNQERRKRADDSVIGPCGRQREAETAENIAIAVEQRGTEADAVRIDLAIGHHKARPANCRKRRAEAVPVFAETGRRGFTRML